MDELIIEAAEQLGYDRNPDFNGAQQEGAGLYQLTIKDGKRHSAAAAFLVPIPDRLNLNVQTGAFVTRSLGKEIAPGVDVLNDEALQAYVRNVATTVWHPVGTCKTGTNSAAVVDASIMPTITTGNTNAPTSMIGEKAADLIKAIA